MDVGNTYCAQFNRNFANSLQLIVPVIGVWRSPPAPPTPSVSANPVQLLSTPAAHSPRTAPKCGRCQPARAEPDGQHRLAHGDFPGSGRLPVGGEGAIASQVKTGSDLTGRMNLVPLVSLGRALLDIKIWLNNYSTYVLDARPLPPNRN